LAGGPASIVSDLPLNHHSHGRSVYASIRVADIGHTICLVGRVGSAPTIDAATSLFFVECAVKLGAVATTISAVSSTGTGPLNFQNVLCDGLNADNYM